MLVCPTLSIVTVLVLRLGVEDQVQVQVLLSWLLVQVQVLPSWRRMGLWVEKTPQTLLLLRPPDVETLDEFQVE